MPVVFGCRAADVGSRVANAARGLGSAASNRAGSV
jgi:hypothetical protein